MTIFTTLLIKLIPLYAMIMLGFVASRWLRAQKETIGSLLIYIITPTVLFYGAYTVPLSSGTIALPILFFTLGCLFGLLFWSIGKMIWPDATANILGFTAGTGNTGYFGLPVVLALFGETGFALASVSILGFVIYENTLGFFITAKGHHTVRESLLKVVKLPVMYAFSLGILCNILSVELGSIIETTIVSFRGAYTVLGMMLIGMGLSGVTLKGIDWKFISMTHLAKFIAWPTVVWGLSFIDRSITHLFSEEMLAMMLVMSIVPLAANTIAFATELKAHPEKASVAVLSSTLVALFYIPLIVAVVGLA